MGRCCRTIYNKISEISSSSMNVKASSNSVFISSRSNESNLVWLTGFDLSNCGICICLRRSMNPIDETVAVSKMTVGNQDVKKKSFIHKIFTMKEREGSGSSGFPEPQSNPAVDIQSISGTETQMPAGQYVQSFRVFVATWNVGGKSPHNDLNLDDFLQVNNESDIYVLGFQEIVPLNAGNVLVLEDNEPAAKWLTLINQSLNKSLDGSSRSKASGSRFSSKPSLKKEHIQYVSHLRISCISRGIMGCLGNKGCISVSFLFHQTSFCFVCSHLASGEKEGDELRRNLDVLEILKSTQFPKICKTTHSRMPDKILGHDMVIWLGDLNYRIALSYSETRKLLENNDWDALLNKDQLKIEREAERVFKGWKEGKIYFAPTYKYFYNSDTYFGEIKTSKKKRRTPAWCDRILWHGNGIKQLSYIRGESRFSDHRPVCGTFVVDVVANQNELKKGSPSSNMKIEIEELLPTARYLKNMY
ncbi:type I inositol polyphosphate 5-phosphatase 10 isoform X1 [Prunus yedoensis var. nudiflora]|uniref:Type I inositol polyphosphate 5-phosphatase 10 isoform X1 n=1 Tax=Prunus yedoensis var. nudiflora TaxID=2094558 RepID=A0A314ZDH7_PRUYE|nr:type I inositol polyphosphate 5-phosphatase 10 isoform X1 [Prunus yedoensis var. nudiflora]